MEYEVLAGNPELYWYGTIDTHVRTNGFNHYKTVARKVCDGLVHAEVTTDNGDEIRMIQRMSSEELSLEERDMGICAETTGEPGVIYRLKKYTVAGTSRDEIPADTCRLQRELECALREADSVRREHEDEWERRWQCAGIEIEGDEEAQRAVNFAVYHLLRCPVVGDDRVAICAKGFAGEAYFGHFFWDTEVYMLPFYLYTMPETAKSLVQFRIRTLEGAKKNAQSYGYDGARYPWESSVSGLEQCPNWQYADHEVHVTADVVLGLWHYYCAVQDREFLKLAAPVFVETASYWLERVEKKADGTVNLNGVMGPDEYICMCNNNAYTNYMVRYALERTLEVLDILGSDAGISKPQEWTEEVQAVIDGLKKKEKSHGVIPQCDGFESFEEPEFDKVWRDRSKAFGTFVSQERNYRTKALKQADVLMLPYLFPEHFDQDQIRENYEYYIPYTTHDSSLSSIIHSILCSRIGMNKEAYEFFTKALDIDLDDRKGGAAEGIHIANCGGICQAVLFGFAGMEFAYEKEELVFHPNLPEHWNSVAFRIVWHGIPYRVRITQDEVQTEREEV